MKRHTMLIALAAATALGAVAGTIWVGSRVREDTVVAQPYEEGLQYDREHHARAALGWTVELGAAPAAGAPGLSFTVRDRRGAPVDGAVAVTAGRPDTGRGQWTVDAVPEGGGAYRADLRLPEAGPWELRFDVRRGDARERITRTVRVAPADPAAAAAAAPCDLGARPCTAKLSGGGEITLALGPRPLHAMTDLAVTADVRDGGAPLAGAEVSIRLDMKGMQMFPIEARLAPAGDGRYAGRAVLVRCPSGRRDWTATVEVRPAAGAPRSAELPLELAE